MYKILYKKYSNYSKKTLHTSIISERISFFKVVLKVDNENAFKGFNLDHKRKMSLPKKLCFFMDFFLRNSVNSLICICLSDLKDQKLPVSAIKTQIDDNIPKILLARWAHKWSGQLACSNYGPNRAIGTCANVKT